MRPAYRNLWHFDTVLQRNERDREREEERAKSGKKFSAQLETFVCLCDDVSSSKSFQLCVFVQLLHSVILFASKSNIAASIVNYLILYIFCVHFVFVFIFSFRLFFTER